MTRPVISDTLQPFRIEGANIRGRVTRLSTSYEGILGSHAYPEPVARMLGETIALTAAISTSIKFDGTFYMQTQGDGPIPMLVADVTSAGQMLGYARYNDEVFTGSLEIGRLVPDLLGAGHLAFTLDQGAHTDRYQGIVALEGDTIAECLDRLTTAITEMLLVVDENRGAELLSKLKRVAPSDVEHAVDDLGRVGQQAGGQRTHDYIDSGAETPSSCRAFDCIASLSLSRRVTKGGTPLAATMVVAKAGSQVRAHNAAVAIALAASQLLRSSFARGSISQYSLRAATTWAKTHPSVTGGLS